MKYYYLLLAKHFILVFLHSLQRQQSVFRPAKNINTKFTASSDSFHGIIQTRVSTKLFCLQQ